VLKSTCHASDLCAPATDFLSRDGRAGDVFVVETPGGGGFEEA